MANRQAPRKPGALFDRLVDRAGKLVGLLDALGKLAKTFGILL